MSTTEKAQPPLRLMERLETYGYLSVGISFLLLGMAVFAHGWFQFARSVTDNVPRSAMVLLHDLLLVVILLELFRITVDFLKTRAISLEPFLYIGIIAAVRKVLTIGADTVLAGEVPAIRFNQYLLDVAVHGGVIIALVIGLYLYRRTRIVESPTRP